MPERNIWTNKVVASLTSFNGFAFVNVIAKVKVAFALLEKNSALSQWDHFFSGKVMNGT